MSVGAVRLGLRENLAQFSLLVAINAFVGAMVGLERSTLPLIGEQDFGLGSSAAVLSFIVAFGLAKAFTNLGAGAFAQRLGRRRLLILGWALALPVPLLIAVAPNWGWVVAANALLGVNQGLAWSMTVVMKIDLVGPKRRGLALGLNEAAGYGGVALAAVVSGWLASEYAARDVLVAGGAVVALVALLLSVLFVRDTAEHVALEQASAAHPEDGPPPLRRAFADATFREPGAAVVLAGGLHEQPERRARLGDRAALPRGPWGVRLRGRAGRRSLPGRLGRGSDLDRPLVRPRRPQAADRRRHAGAGGGARTVSGLRRRRRHGGDCGRRTRDRDGARLPDADRRDLGRCSSGRARAGGRRLPLLARHGLRRRRAGRRGRRRRDRLQRRHRAGRGAHRCFGAVGVARHAGPAGASDTKKAQLA